MKTIALSRRSQWVVAAVLVFFGALAILPLTIFGGSHVGTSAPPSVRSESGSTFRAKPEQLASFGFEPVKLADFRSERSTDGRIAVNGDRATPVFSPYSGRVTRVFAKVGERVGAHEKLLAVDASEFVQGQSDLLGATNALESARAQLGLAQANERRKHALYDAKGGSLQDWQQSQADVTVAASTVRSADAALAAVRNRLRIQGRTDAEISSLEKPRAMTATAFVVSPISGTVMDRQVGPGQFIQSGAATPVFTIADLSTVWLVGNMREIDAPSISVGQPVTVSVLALPGRVFQATIDYVAPSVDPATRRVAVRAQIANPGGVLKPEMFATFSVATGRESASPAVRESAVIHEGDTSRVWVVGSGDEITLRPIQTGRNGNGLVEVVDGLAPGERVVTHGALFVDAAARGS